MQPYFLPYIGYWQLINESDKFVILDDVNFIKRGWISRNKINVNGIEQFITIPVINGSINSLINDLHLQNTSTWLPKLNRKIEYNFNKEQYFDNVFKLFNSIVDYKDLNLSNFLENSIRLVCEYLNINTKIYRSSQVSPVKDNRGALRIIEICKSLGAHIYINPIGGQSLYSKTLFSENGIDLEFINTKLHDKFLNSILQTMMFSNPCTFQTILKEFEIS